MGCELIVQLKNAQRIPLPNSRREAGVQPFGASSNGAAQSKSSCSIEALMQGCQSGNPLAVSGTPRADSSPPCSLNLPLGPCDTMLMLSPFQVYSTALHMFGKIHIYSLKSNPLPGKSNDIFSAITKATGKAMMNTLVDFVCLL